MDSSDLETEMKADNSSMNTPSKRDIFLSTYRHQNFSLLNLIIFYIAKNPKNTKVYQKMIKSCKYFFIKNPILVVSHLRYNQNEWKTVVKNAWKNIDINRIKTKLWITDYLSLSIANDSNNSLASSIIPKIYHCDFDYLSLYHQIIYFHEFMLLCSSVEVLVLDQVTVKNNDGTVVSFENIVEQLPQLKVIDYTFTSPSNNTSKNIWKELWKIPHLSNYDRFCLYNIPENFDIDIFYSYMKKNKKTDVALEFSDEISEEYKSRLEMIIDEISETKNREYKPPFIEFPGLDIEKLFKLHIIFYG